MNVIFPVIKSSSGSDIYFTLLHNALKKQGVYSEIVWLDYRYEFIPFFAKKLWRKLSGFDIVHTNADYGCLFKFPNKPLVITLHHNVLDHFYQKYTSLSQKIYHFSLLKKRIQNSLFLADTCVCVSAATYNSFSRHFRIERGKATVIHNGIDVDLFKKPACCKTHKNSILFVGNVSKRKGADLLPLIMERLGTDYSLECIAFSPPPSAFTKENIRVTAGVSPSELVTHYNRADIFLFPSRLEGFGYAVAEAMACEKPVVCSSSSSLPELVDHGKGGMLCAPDNIDCYVENIQKLSANPDLKKHMGAYNRKKIEDTFSTDIMAKKYISIYERLANK